MLRSDIFRWRPPTLSGKTILRTKNTAFRLSFLSCTHRWFRGLFDTELVYVTLPTCVFVFLNCYMCIVLDHFVDNTSVMLVTFCETSRSFGYYAFFVFEKTLHQISARRATILTVFFPGFSSASRQLPGDSTTIGDGHFFIPTTSIFANDPCVYPVAVENVISQN